jgi:hypothetical protein
MPLDVKKTGVNAGVITEKSGVFAKSKKKEKKRTMNLQRKFI